MGLNVVKAGSGPEAEEMMSLWKNLVDLFPAKEQTLLMLGSYTEVCAHVPACVFVCVPVCVRVCFSVGGAVHVLVLACVSVCMHFFTYMCICMFVFKSVVHVFGSSYVFNSLPTYNGFEFSSFQKC